VKDYQKEFLIGLSLLIIAYVALYYYYQISLTIADKIGMDVITIMLYPFLVLFFLTVLPLGILFIWVSLEDKKLEKALKEWLEKENL